MIDPGFYDWSDSDNGENQGSSNAPYNDSPEYPGPAAYPDSGTAPGSPPESGFAEDNSSGRIPRRQPFISSPSSASEAQEPLTVIFKDGRSPEQILNYIVSSTALTDLDQGHYQRIPLDQVDLDATEQTNRARGLIFQVPRTSGD